jgi:hypothetical protein
MKASISARGYTNVLLVLNMKRFVHEKDQDRFEKIRGRSHFAQALNVALPEKLNTQKQFISLHEDKQRRGRPEDMTTEEVGFATGVFRSLMLERYTAPAFALDKEEVSFSEDLKTNFQFKKLFLRAWRKWSIYIRATPTGFFIIRLTRRHFEQPRPFIKLAQDVLQLQESLDIQSALNWMKDSQLKYKDSPEILEKKEKSVKAFLSWLGAGENYSGNILYYPIQWRLAMEVCGLFVNSIGLEIPIPGEAEPIHLISPEPSISIPLHDSYVVHHFTELLADSSVAERLKNGTRNAQAHINLNDIRNSGQLRQALSNLIEGSALKYSASGDPTVSETESLVENVLFPNHRWKIADDILEPNHSSWEDELCVLRSKTALIMPAAKWKDYELLVASVPGATLLVDYLRYWSAIERMIEFLVEIRVLSQLLESESHVLLGDIAQTVHETRSKLFSGDIKLDERLPNLVTRAAYLRHLAALSRSISHPHLWSRAEYAIRKASYLLEQLGVPTIQDNIERNISSISSVVDHVDELYLADLSEKQNDNSTILSIGLAAASLTLTLLMLPSFWADIQASMGTPWSWAMLTIGDMLSLILIVGALYMLRIAFLQRRKVKQLFDKFLKDGS